METIYKPLTPALRKDIMVSIDRNMEELNTCQQNAFVAAQKIGLKATRTVINALPDGCLIPFERKG